MRILQKHTQNKNSEKSENNIYSDKLFTMRKTEKNME